MSHPAVKALIVLEQKIPYLILITFKNYSVTVPENMSSINMNNGLITIPKKRISKEIFRHKYCPTNC